MSTRRSRPWSACWRARPRASICIGWLTPIARNPPMNDERRQPFSRLLLIDQVAEALGVSMKTVYRLIARRELVACRLGRSVRVHPDDLTDYVDRQRGR